MITNISVGEVLATRVTPCDTALERARGLMFRGIAENEAYLFRFARPARVWIHMLFVFMPLDLIFIDEGAKVVHVVENARPFQIAIRPPLPISTLIELPAGTIRRSGTRIGHTVSF